MHCLHRLPKVFATGKPTTRWFTLCLQNYFAGTKEKMIDEDTSIEGESDAQPQSITASLGKRERD